MIPIFSHYVPGRLIFLAALEAGVLLLAAYVGISMHMAEPGVIASSAPSLPPQIVAFVFGMLIVMSSMGLYQPDLWGNTQAVGVRLVAALVLGFTVIGLVSHLVPSLHFGPHALGGALVVALTGSIVVRAAFFKWSNLGVFKSRVLVLGRMKGRGKASGVEFEAPAAWVCELRDGKVAKVHFYAHEEAARDELQLDG